MLVVWILLALVAGFVLGHFLWTKTKIETVFKEVVVNPADYNEYLNWAEHKDEWINLAKIVPDVTIQDDDKFEKIMEAINKTLNTTESPEFTSPKSRKRKK